MGKDEKRLFRILSGLSDTNIAFEELRDFLKDIGFEERIRGSHHIFRREGVSELINLQRDDSKAKPYQVKQVRNVIVKYRLTKEV
jgi:hypothetical protein